MNNNDRIAIWGPIAQSRDFTTQFAPERLLARTDVNEAIVRNNNANILVFSGRAVRYLKKFRAFQHAREIWIPVSAMLVAIPFLSRFLVDGRLRHIGMRRVANARLVCFSVHDRKNRGVSNRYFIPSDWDVADFLAGLTRQGVKYAYLRWPELLRDMKEGEDVDLLIDDADALRVRDMLQAQIGNRPVDLHTVSGTVAGVSDGMAYLPPHFAKELLAHCTPNDLGVLVPSDRDYMLSLAYHAAYQKGRRCGLPDRGEKPDPDNKYYRELDRLRQQTGLSCELSLEGLVALLVDHGWEPPFDVKAKLAANNQWLSDRIIGNIGQDGPEDLSVFVLRDIVMTWGMLDECRAELLEQDFDILAESSLEGDRKKLASLNIRGGDWSAGNFPVDAGFPCHAFLVRDKRPQAPDKATIKKSRFISNARPSRFKEAWREKFNSRLPADKRANFVHCSDNNQEALDYVHWSFENGKDIAQRARQS
ncbi:hypothetical protein LPB41_12925 [Thalassospira sp. MA62]|nr:hypothetical protein [Thalassospira sp. MA62]